MSHEIDTMAYAGETPWHGLGYRIPADLTPEQMMEAAKVGWEVRKIPAHIRMGDKRIPIGRSALVRMPWHAEEEPRILDVVGNDWNVTQNSRAFEFFADYVAAGDMEMHTAGSLKGGKVVWALARVKESFEAVKGDEIQQFLLFTNPHMYGWPIDIRMTPTRVVCWNTLSMALGSKATESVRITHRVKFDPEKVKVVMGVASKKLGKYAEKAKFLASKRYSPEAIREYLSEVFPVAARGDDHVKEVSNAAKQALSVVETQPGADRAPGTWWNAFNAVTYSTDHILGRNQDNRLWNSWYGGYGPRKVKALDRAVEFAAVA